MLNCLFWQVERVAIAIAVAAFIAQRIAIRAARFRVSGVVARTVIAIPVYVNVCASCGNNCK